MIRKHYSIAIIQGKLQPPYVSGHNIYRANCQRYKLFPLFNSGANAADEISAGTAIEVSLQRRHWSWLWLSLETTGNTSTLTFDINERPTLLLQSVLTFCFKIIKAFTAIIVLTLPYWSPEAHQAPRTMIYTGM